MRLVFSNLIRSQPSNSLEAVGFSTPMQFFEPRKLGCICRNDNLPATLMRDPVLLAEAVHRFAPFDAILCFQRARFVVQTGMDDAAVVAGLMRREPVLRLEQNHSQAWPSRQQRVRGGKAHYAAADDCNVVSHFSHIGPLILQDDNLLRLKLAWTMHTILWRRMDTAGHDACRLSLSGGGSRLDGVATFQHEGEPACLVYEVDCDGAWRTRQGIVTGWIGTQEFDYTIKLQANGTWTVNGVAVAALDGCLDLDLGFTPATNLFQLKRVKLRVGQTADVPVAWFDLPVAALQPVHQRYERRTTTTYWYESPQFDYAALLQVNNAGFVEKYPGLWEAVS